MKTNPVVIPEILRSLKPGDTVYTILRHVSRSGMQKEVSALMVQDGRIFDITYPVARAINRRIGKHDGVIVNGCGFDTGAEIVEHLSRTLWPDGTLTRAFTYVLRSPPVGLRHVRL